MDENAAGAAPTPGFKGAGREHPALWPLCVGGGGQYHWRQYDPSGCGEVVSDVFFDLWRQSEQVRPGHLKGFFEPCGPEQGHQQAAAAEAGAFPGGGRAFPAPTRPGAAGGDHEPARAGPGGAPGHWTRWRRWIGEIFLRHYYYCQTVSAVALELGLKPSTVKSRLARGRK